MQPATFGKYRIVGKLLGGGMGRVYLAEDGPGGRRVALKLIDIGTDQDTREVLEAERRGAALQARLSEIDHRVAQVCEAGERDGYFYIAMEYVEGQDLSEIVARGPMPAWRAVAVAIELCEVLAHAHTLDGHGIVHGDIKPRNIRITPEGRVKVLDFGIAKALSATRNFTRNQFGSVPYSSPERLNTGEVDAASDLWSVAVVLYEMLQGAPYFRAENNARVEALIRNYEALLPAIEDVPPGLQQILARALAPQPQYRYPTAGEFQADLLAFREGRLAVAGQDPDATRRTAPRLDDDATRRTSPPAPEAATMRTAPAAAAPARRMSQTTRSVIWIVVFLVLGIGFWLEGRTWKQANALRQDIEMERVGVDEAWNRYQKLVSGTFLPMNFSGVRGAMAARFITTGDRVLAEYRESDVASVYQRDWERARTAFTRALEVDPGDKSIRARLKVAEGHLARINASGRNQGRSLREAREDFEEAKNLAPRSPDAYLGLVHLYIYGLKDVEKAEQELKEAERHNYRATKRVRAQIADGYNDRADGWIREATKANGLPQEMDYWQRADADYAHAESLFQDLVPYGNSVAMLRRIFISREQAQARLAMLKGQPQQ
ncbi:MAG TPA: serine/threonine-protein kinase [Bryobacteraceae bacterium]|nr:serine/threonine-protein kinase [Bryobacteraceae bacterium]